MVTIADCDGADAIIMAETECTVPIATFTQVPFSLDELGSPINVRVKAYNSYGESTFSEVGGGAVIQKVPDAPISL